MTCRKEVYRLFRKTRKHLNGFLLSMSRCTVLPPVQSLRNNGSRKVWEPLYCMRGKGLGITSTQKSNFQIPVDKNYFEKQLPNKSEFNSCDHFYISSRDGRVQPLFVNIFLLFINLYKRKVYYPPVFLLAVCKSF